LPVTHAWEKSVPLMAPFYRNSVNRFPELMLHVLGIANVKYRMSFYTLDRIINAIDNFDSNVIECGTYKGNTLLGIAHLLKKRGIDVIIYGLDSFEGLPEPARQDALQNGTFHNHAQKGFFKDALYYEPTEKI